MTQDNKKQLTHRYWLSDSEEKKRELEEWANSTLDKLFEYADLAPGFAEELCEKIVKKYSSNDKLAGQMRNQIKKDRAGMTKGPHKKWTAPRHAHLLQCYEIGMESGMERSQLLSSLADMEGFTGANGIKKIEARITEARKLRDKNLLP